MTEIYNPDDWPVDEYIVKDISVYDDGGFGVSTTDSSGFGVGAEEAKDKPLPKPGDKIVLLGGWGSTIKGINIGGVQYRYKSQTDVDRERQEWLDNYAREKEEAFYANIADYIKRKNALDKPFQERMDRFANKGFKEFWTESGSYELYAVEQANKLYRHFDGDATLIEEFKDLSWDEQKARFPELDEGHSGNTFGAMVWLARAVANGEAI